MGCRSTVDITRADALDRIRAALLDASDERLAAVLEDLYGEDTASNYRITESPDPAFPWRHDWRSQYGNESDVPHARFARKR